jgi:exodeoxyribonuclease VII small subunit
VKIGRGCLRDWRSLYADVFNSALGSLAAAETVRGAIHKQFQNLTGESPSVVQAFFAFVLAMPDIFGRDKFRNADWHPDLIAISCPGKAGGRKLGSRTGRRPTPTGVQNVRGCDMAVKAVSADIAKMSFEDALAELEEIVSRLEQGSAKLDDAIKDYERGSQLKRHCEAKLAEAKARVDKINIGPDGAVSAEPADAE